MTIKLQQCTMSNCHVRENICHDIFIIVNSPTTDGDVAHILLFDT